MADLSRLTTHDDNITITILLDNASTQQRGFGTVAFLADKANGTDFGADRYASYSSYAEVNADSQVSATVKGMALVAFSQNPAPETLIIAHVDTAAAETYADGLTALLAKTTDFYGVAIESRADADILSIAAAVEATGYLVCSVQTDDTGFLTAGYPGGLSALENLERTLVTWHDTDAQWAAEALIVNRLVFDPDEGSAPWDAPVSAVSGHATTRLTQSQKDALDTNKINYGLPYGTYAYFIDAGVNTAGRPFYEIVTRDWYEARLLEQVAELKTQKSANGEKIPVSKEGQRLILAIVDGLFEQGSSGDSPHFIPGQYTSSGVTITAADRTAQKMRFTAAAQLAVGGRLFEFDIKMGRDPVNA